MSISRLSRRVTDVVQRRWRTRGRPGERRMRVVTWRCTQWLHAQHADAARQLQPYRTSCMADASCAFLQGRIDEDSFSTTTTPMAYRLDRDATKSPAPSPNRIVDYEACIHLNLDSRCPRRLERMGTISECLSQIVLQVSFSGIFA